MSEYRRLNGSARVSSLICLPKDSSEKMDPPQWRDLTVPGVSTNPAGAVGGTSYDDVNLCQTFPNGSSTRFDCGWQVNHDASDASTFNIHVHGRFSSAGVGTTCDFSVAWRAWANGVADPGFTTVVVQVPYPGDTHLHYFSLVSIPGVGAGLSMLVDLKLIRLGGTDSYGGDFRMQSLDGHYTVDRFGSLGEGAE